LLSKPQGSEFGQQFEWAWRQSSTEPLECNSALIMPWFQSCKSLKGRFSGTHHSWTFDPKNCEIITSYCFKRLSWW
jgi:hypothetical protein